MSDLTQEEIAALKTGGVDFAPRRPNEDIDSYKKRLLGVAELAVELIKDHPEAWKELRQAFGPDVDDATIGMFLTKPMPELIGPEGKTYSPEMWIRKNWDLGKILAHVPKILH